MKHLGRDVAIGGVLLVVAWAATAVYLLYGAGSDISGGFAAAAESVWQGIVGKESNS